MSLCRVSKYLVSTVIRIQAHTGTPNVHSQHKLYILTTLDIPQLSIFGQPNYCPHACGSEGSRSLWSIFSSASDSWFVRGQAEE